jgi:hypothetical protein
MAERQSLLGIGLQTSGVSLMSPVSGAYFPISIHLTDATTTTDVLTYVLDDYLPAGMKLRIIGMTVYTRTLTAGSMAAELGRSGDINGICLTTAFTTAVATHTSCDGAEVNDIDGSGNGDYLFNPEDTASTLDELVLTVTRTGATHLDAHVTIWACPVAHADVLVVRPQGKIYA